MKFSFLLISLLLNGFLFAQTNQDGTPVQIDPYLLSKQMESEKEEKQKVKVSLGKTSKEISDAQRERNRKLKLLTPQQAYQFVNSEDKSDEKLNELILDRQSNDDLNRSTAEKRQVNATDEKPKSMLFKVGITVLLFGVAFFLWISGKNNEVADIKIHRKEETQNEKNSFTLEDDAHEESQGK